MRKAFLVIIVALAAAILLSACWDMMAIENEAFILSLGFDTVNPEELKQPSPTPFAPQKQVHLTLEVFSPQLHKKTNGEQSTVILHVSGATFSECLKLAQSQTTRKLSLVHLRAIIVGEEYARRGIEDIVSCLERNPRIAGRFLLAFLQDSRAEDLLNAKTLLETDVAEVLTKLAESASAFGFHRTIDFTDLKKQLKYNQGTAYATRLHLSPNKWLSKAGAAVLKDWKLAGWLNPYEVRSANWVTGQIDEATVAVESRNMRVSYNVSDASTKIIPSILGTQPYFQVKIRTDGFLSEIENCPPEGINLELLEEIKQAIAQRIRAEAASAAAKSQQEFAADYLGFRESFHNRFPHIHEKLNWAETYPQVAITIEADVHIAHFGKKL